MVRHPVSLEGVDVSSESLEQSLRTIRDNNPRESEVARRLLNRFDYRVKTAVRDGSIRIENILIDYTQYNIHILKRA